MKLYYTPLLLLQSITVTAASNNGCAALEEKVDTVEARVNLVDLKIDRILQIVERLESSQSPAPSTEEYLSIPTLTPSSEPSSSPSNLSTSAACNLDIGDRDNNDKREKRKVKNKLPKHCNDSDIVSINITHDGKKKSFKKLKSKSSEQGQKKSNIKSLAYWYGEDDTDGSTFNYVQDEDGNIHGSLIDMSSNSVMQFAIEDGTPTVVITGSSDFGPEIEPPNNEDDFVERNLSLKIREPAAEAYQSTRSYLSFASEKQEQASRGLNDDSGGNLDVMVVWTSKAECRNYGLNEGCTLTAATTAAMEALINLAIDETNTAFDLSGVQTQLFLAHAYRHPTFTETSMPNALKALRSGGISGTEQNRETYGADLVAMIVDEPLYCGIAYVGPRIDRMYSVTAWKCATGYFSFGHEIGHNLGLRHDRGTEFQCDSTKFHYGYRDPEARFRTILAYDSVTDQCDNNPGGGCPRIQRFSNDDDAHSWNGLPAGDTSNNNARKINRIKSTVALYLPHGGTAQEAPTVSPSSQALSSSPSYTSSSVGNITPYPSTFPSQSPTVSPSIEALDKGSSPFPSQTLTVSPSLSACNNSPLEFSYQGQVITCTTVASQNLCSDPEIQAICPATCNTCSNCVDPGLLFTYFNTKKGIWQTKDCGIIANNPSVRCAFDGVSDTCRVTCVTC